ncbi:MAG: RluA family pseudouridine synthase [Bacteroidales bacterium]|nr:RluA family pseudouridine synthase [Bacteroidales bacterium]
MEDAGFSDLQLTSPDEPETEDSVDEPSFVTDDGRELYEHFRFEADKGQQLLRVDKFLVDRMTKTSRNRIQQAADAGCIIVNGRPVKSSYKVKPLDVVSIVMDRPRYEFEIIPQDIPLDVVYEDRDVMVVNKPAGLVVHPGHGNYSGTLVNALAYYFRDNPDYDVSDPRLGLVHRIDKDTSGLLVIAKTPEAKTDLGLQFFNKTTRREYVALVWGDFPEDSGTIVGNIARNPKNKLQMAVFSDPEIGKHALTHWSVLERFGYVTAVKCVLETGRTHQIRVHMLSQGHPLFNDARYGGDRILKGTTFAKYRQFVENCFNICPRQALHARTLGFRHPATGQQMDFECPIPTDMEALLQKWRDYSSQSAAAKQ